jgi:putative peptidoglycan lipid II flippase
MRGNDRNLICAGVWRDGHGLAIGLSLPHFTTPDGMHFGTPAFFPPKIILMLQLLRVMFPYMLLVCLAAAMMGMLNARGPFFCPRDGRDHAQRGDDRVRVLARARNSAWGCRKEQRLPVQIFALAYGVLAAGVAQAAFQMPTLWRDGFRYRWVSPWKNETVRLVVRQMIPGTIGVAAFQINVALVPACGAVCRHRIVSSFNGAVRLMELPQGMFGISLATYLLPTLSGLARIKIIPNFAPRCGTGWAR